MTKPLEERILGEFDKRFPNPFHENWDDEILNESVKAFISQALAQQRAEIRGEIALLQILGKGIDNGIHNSALQQALNISPLKENE